MRITQNYIAHAVLAFLIFTLPLYLRVTSIPNVNLLRVSKDDYFTVIAIVICVLFVSIRRIQPAFYLALLAIPALLINNYNPASMAPIGQTIYIATGLCFALKLASSYDKQYEPMILNSICAAALFQCLIGLLQYFGVNANENFYSLFFNVSEKITLPQNQMMYGTLGNPNVFGAFLAMSSPAFFRKSWVKYLAVILPCVALSTSSLGAMTLLVTALAFVFMELWQDFLSWVMGIVVSLYLIFIAINPWDIANGRFNILSTIFETMTPVQRIFGTGPGWLWDAQIRIGDTLYKQDHSEPFAIYRIAGIAGISLFFYLMHKALKETDHRIFFAMLCASLFNSMGNFNLHTSPTSLIFLVAISGCIAMRENGCG